MSLPKSGFGERLRAEREARGIALEDISALTRVSVRLLRSIETEDFGELPGGVFSIAFVRQYARHVGLDEDAVVEEFKSLARPLEVGLGVEEIPEDRGATIAESFVERARRYQVTAPIVWTVLLAFIAGAVMLFQWDWDSSFSALGETFFGEEWASVEPSTPPAASAPAGIIPYVEPKSVKAVNVKLSMTATVWIRAVADGERVFQRTFRSGDSESIEADQDVRLLVGNAGGVSVSLNGNAMAPVGLSGQVRRVLLTKYGMEVLQPPSKQDVDSESPRAPQVQASNAPTAAEPALARSVTPSN